MEQILTLQKFLRNCENFPKRRNFPNIFQNKVCRGRGKEKGEKDIGRISEEEDGGTHGLKR